MGNLLLVFVWVLPSVGVGLFVGLYVGRTAFADKHRDRMEKDRQQTLQALATLLESTDRLNADVDSHNNEMTAMEQHVVDLKASGELESVQQTLLGHIASVVEANKRLEDDLTYTRFKMEQQAQELDRSRAEARIDSLSGIGNRKAFDEALQFMLAGWNRHRDSFVLVVADIDHFKWINDTHGHPAGDRVVNNVGKFLKEQIRATDYVARFGGDEFAILYSKVDLEVGQFVADRIWRGITRKNFDVGDRGQRIAVTFSMGVAAVRSGDTVESILRRADDALYRAKQAGRNQVKTEADATPLFKREEPKHEEPEISAADEAALARAASEAMISQSLKGQGFVEYST